MLPTLKDGDVVFINRLTYLFRKPEVGEIIGLNDPRDNKVLIKRILKITENKYFVTGDNKQSSTDSRQFGMIEKSAIIGRVLI